MSNKDIMNNGCVNKKVLQLVCANLKSLFADTIWYNKGRVYSKNNYLPENRKIFKSLNERIRKYLKSPWMKVQSESWLVAIEMYNLTFQQESRYEHSGLYTVYNRQ